MNQIVLADDSLSEKQYRAIELYSLGHKTHEICDNLGITKPTYQRWMRNPIFRSQINQIMHATMTVANTRVASMHEKALADLETMQHDPSLRPRMKLDVINSIIRISENLRKDSEVVAEMEVHENITTNRDPEGNVIGITEQKNILKRIRNGPQQILETESTTVRDDDGGDKEILQ